MSEINAVVKGGKFEGKQVTVVFGESWRDTKVLINNERLQGIESINLCAEVDRVTKIQINMKNVEIE